MALAGAALDPAAWWALLNKRYTLIGVQGIVRADQHRQHRHKCAGDIGGADHERRPEGRLWRHTADARDLHLHAMPVRDVLDLDRGSEDGLVAVQAVQIDDPAGGQAGLDVADARFEHALALAGGIIADIWSHPTGTAAAGNGLANLWTPSLQAVSGQGISTRTLSKQ